VLASQALVPRLIQPLNKRAIVFSEHNSSAREIQSLNDLNASIFSQEKRSLENEKIGEGDYVLLCLDPRRTYMVKVEAGKSFHTHKGFMKLDELVGKNFGATVKSSLGIEFTALQPSLTDYIMKSSRQTQITYPKDAALIVMFSGIGPGSHIAESGTGTGALTTVLAHYVKPNGKVYSYELREEFQKNAEKNLKRAKLLDFVELKSGDVTTGIAERNLDAVILDLAVPWLVVPHAYEALKPSGTLVSFSPTIDQVVKTTEALKENSFVLIETVECLMRAMQVERGKTRPHTMMTGHTGYITHARKAMKSQQETLGENAL
jgi:tRNA (adenine57-N1/adenine58-N1)-methyltransferase